jgi:hypothetical protein
MWSLVPTLAAVGVSAALLGVGQTRETPGLLWAGAGTFGAGIALPPSFGHFYARQIRRGSVLSAIRSVLSAAVLVPPAAMWYGPRYSEGMVFASIAYLAIAGPIIGLTNLILAIYDIATVGRSVDKANAAYREKLGQNRLADAPVR